MMSTIDVSTVFTDSAPTIGAVAEGEVVGFVPDPFNDHPRCQLTESQVQNLARKAIDVLGLDAATPFTVDVLSQLRGHYQIRGRRASFAIIEEAKRAAAAMRSPDEPMTDAQNNQRTQWLQALTGVSDFGPTQAELNRRVKNPTPLVAAAMPTVLTQLLGCRTHGDWQAVRSVLVGLFGEFRYASRRDGDPSGSEVAASTDPDGWSNGAYDPEDV